MDKNDLLLPTKEMDNIAHEANKKMTGNDLIDLNIFGYALSVAASLHTAKKIREEIFKSGCYAVYLLQDLDSAIAELEREVK